jgi:hypothetical protein
MVIVQIKNISQGSNAGAEKYDPCGDVDGYEAD